MITSLRFLTAAAVLALGVGAATPSSAVEQGGSSPESSSYGSGGAVVALAGDKTLLFIEGGRVVRRLEVRNLAGRLVGIDVRPSNQLLYGLVRVGASTGQVVVIDLRSGAATMRSTLSVPLPAGDQLAIDFNPAVDRLRIVGPDGTNLRANVDDGSTLVDGPINYAQPNPFGGSGTPVLVGVAYTNSRPGTVPAVTLRGIDAKTDALYQLQPPNDGTLVPIGRLGIAVTGLGFDIATDARGRNRGVVVAGSRLLEIDLAGGAIVASRSVRGASGMRDVAALIR